MINQICNKKIKEFKDNDGNIFTIYKKSNNHNYLTIKKQNQHNAIIVDGSRNKIINELKKYWKGQGTFKNI